MPLRPFIPALLAILTLQAAAADQAHPPALRIAVAANFAATLEHLIAACEPCRGERVVTTPGASGLLFGQIVAGAPFDLFFSADAERPQQLEARGLVVPGSRHTYAIGRLALWAPGRVLPGDPRQALLDPRTKVLAIANPQIAPYGKAAVEVMTALGVQDRPGLRVVRGGSLGQTFQFVASGNADLGFVALAQLIEYDAHSGGNARSEALLIDPALHAPIVQQVVRLAGSSDDVLVARLLDFLVSEPALTMLRDAGYELPSRAPPP